MDCNLWGLSQFQIFTCACLVPWEVILSLQHHQHPSPLVQWVQWRKEERIGKWVWDIKNKTEWLAESSIGAWLSFISESSIAAKTSEAAANTASVGWTHVVCEREKVQASQSLQKNCVNLPNKYQTVLQFVGVANVSTLINECLMDQLTPNSADFSRLYFQYYCRSAIYHSLLNSTPETWWMHEAPDPMNWKAITSTNHLGGWGKQTTSDIPPNSAHVLVLLLTQASARKGLFVWGVNKNSTDWYPFLCLCANPPDNHRILKLLEFNSQEGWSRPSLVLSCLSRLSSCW